MNAAGSDIDKFQNILCYCLTAGTELYIADYKLFQNILCYCLTPPRLLPWDCCRISKHPMLLFNHVHFQANESMNTFQNILCYCLTSTFSALWTLCCISKHPMLLFNTGICVKTTTIQLISKHPMLLFNCFPLCRTSCSRLFQNILCYCLTCGA